jgi:hypothetical protein
MFDHLSKKRILTTIRNRCGEGLLRSAVQGYVGIHLDLMAGRLLGMSSAAAKSPHLTWSSL